MRVFSDGGFQPAASFLILVATEERSCLRIFKETGPQIHHLTRLTWFACLETDTQLQNLLYIQSRFTQQKKRRGKEKKIVKQSPVPVVQMIELDKAEEGTGLPDERSQKLIGSGQELQVDM